MSSGTKSAVERYYEMQLEKEQRENGTQKWDQVEKSDEYKAMDAFEQAKFKADFDKRELKKVIRKNTAQVKFDEKKKDIMKNIKEHKKLLPKIVNHVLTGREYVRDQASRKKTFIPAWAKKFTQRPITKGDELDVVYMMMVLKRNWEFYSDHNDWHKLTGIIEQQLEVFGSSLVSFDLPEISDTALAQLVLNGKKPTRHTKAVQAYTVHVRTVDDYHANYELYKKPDADKSAKLLRTFITNLTDKELQDFLDRQVATDAETPLQKFIETSEEFKTYLVKNSSYDPQKWMTELHDQDNDHVGYFIYIASVLHQAGFKLPEGVVNFLKDRSDYSSCYNVDNQTGYSSVSRAIRILGNFNTIKDIVLHGKLIQPKELVNICDCDADVNIYVVDGGSDDDEFESASDGDSNDDEFESESDGDSRPDRGIFGNIFNSDIMNSLNI